MLLVGEFITPNLLHLETILVSRDNQEEKLPWTICRSGPQKRRRCQAENNDELRENRFAVPWRT